MSFNLRDKVYGYTKGNFWDVVFLTILGAFTILLVYTATLFVLLVISL